MATRDLARRLGVAFIAVGAVLVAYVGLVLADSMKYQADYRASIASGEASVTGAAADAPMPVAPLVTGAAIGEIRIDRLGLRSVIGQGDSTTVLRRGVGHLADTAWLGQAGNVALAGHRDTVFRALQDVRRGDRIDVTTPGRSASYEVQSTKVVAPDALDVLTSTDGNTLTLITCYPFNYIGAAPNRFIVRATEIR